jgi:hypothetical protein|nr:DUF1904 family protein [uncultured Oscillibacter sp.]
MPHITVRGIDSQELREMSMELKGAVVEAAQVKEEYVKVFWSPVCRVDAPDEVALDVYWMHRPQELCDKVAGVLTQLMKNKGRDFVQITFTEFPGSHFYENSEHY